ncbi:hypothetical protein [Streptosporangium sp. NPDC001681]|uniref:hypothetical protein n=1 Tax=Streptosporangium sp. NPDC001681 TaxID=3154395 RepID=UPI00332701B6
MFRKIVDFLRGRHRKRRSDGHVLAEKRGESCLVGSRHRKHGISLQNLLGRARLDFRRLDQRNTIDNVETGHPAWA